MPGHPASNGRGALAGLAAFAVFASHDVVVKILGARFEPFQIVFFSVLFGFPIVTVMLMRDRTDGNLRPKHPYWSALRTAMAVITGLCVFYAFSTLPLAETYAILFSMPLLITMLAIPVLGEKVGWRRGLAVIVGLIGVIVVLQPGDTELTLGHLAAVIGAATGATAAVIVRKIGQDERAAVLLLYPMVANFVVMACFLPFVYKPVQLTELGGFGLMALLSFGGTLLQIAAYRLGSAVIVAPMQYSQIIWATLFGVLLFDEIPNMNTAIGAVIIIASGLYIVFREDRKSGSGTPVLRSRSRFGVPMGAPRVSVMQRLSQRRRTPRGEGAAAPLSPPAE
ncbi:EamA family transporter [Pacificitalea manganoxidans]|uniref:EamA family transporter n=1 Tax=Pacificitalea manganoxidans TaxID=1411902 RepID=A0A291LW04_9RHOB|nr:DMT family transporter [Pacificitalea manganoxidans]ATI40889.1 EamA family transporter [Pacificitalea manganoxidans]MDR6308222.1 S-adenosylmethionine uptake transporter [Pacificitalea manganoxidans]OWU70815.1 membrane protein [Roseovarius sp. 22II1-1F6A]